MSTGADGLTRWLSGVAAVAAILSALLIWHHQLQMNHYRTIGYAAMQKIAHMGVELDQFSVTLDSLAMEVEQLKRQVNE